MNHEPLDPEFLELLAAERARDDVPAEAKAAVLADLTAIIGGGGGAGGGVEQGAGGSGAAGILSARAAAVALGAFLAGAAGGAWLRGETPARIVYVERPVPSAVSSVPLPAVSVLDLPPASAQPVAALSVHSPTTKRAVVPNTDAGRVLDRDESLAGERVLVDTGRTALARGDYAAALDALSRHASEFPNGQLAEEREVLAVQALAGSHRRQEAAQRAARFRLKYPTSVLLPVLDEALR